MTHSLRAVLLSGLVFPGLGQWLLGYRIRAVAFMLAVSICLVVIVHQATQQAYAVLDQLQAAGSALDMATIWDTAAQATRNIDSSVVQQALIALMLLWVVSMVDAYRAGRLKDREEKSVAGS